MMKVNVWGVNGNSTQKIHTLFLPQFSKGEEEQAERVVKRMYRQYEDKIVHAKYRD